MCIRDRYIYIIFIFFEILLQSAVGFEHHEKVEKHESQQGIYYLNLQAHLISVDFDCAKFKGCKKR